METRLSDLLLKDEQYDALNMTPNPPYSGNPYATLADVVSGATVGADKFIGDWNPLTNTPALVGGVGAKGQYYRVSANAIPVQAEVTGDVNNSSEIDVVSATGIAPGMTIQGPGIPTGTTVLSLTGTSLTISVPVTLTDGDTVFFPVTKLDGFNAYKLGDFTYFNGTAWVPRRQVPNTYNAGWSRGSWARGAYYGVNDIVRNGTTMYVCTTAHVSGAFFSAVNFTLFQPAFQVPVATAAQILAGTDNTVFITPLGLAGSGYRFTTDRWEGDWNPNTNTPQLAGPTATQRTLGEYWRVSATAVPITLTATQATRNDTLISVTSTSSLIPGMAVSGATIPLNTVIIQIAGPTDLFISAAVTINSGDKFVFKPKLGTLTDLQADDYVWFDGQNWHLRDFGRRTSGSTSSSPAMPLYSGTGVNTDGPMTQKATTDALAAAVASPVVVTTSGGTFPYTTLNAAVRAFPTGVVTAGQRATRLNAKVHTLSGTTTLSDYVIGNESLVYLADGAVLSLRGAFRAENISITTAPDAVDASGFLYLRGNTAFPGDAVQGTSELVNCNVNTYASMTGTLVLTNTHLYSVQGSGTLYLYGTTSVDIVDSALITVIDRRPTAIKQITKFPATGTTSGLTVNTPYYQDGNLAKLINSPGSTPIPFDFTDNNYWDLIAGGFTSGQRNSLLALINLYAGVSDVLDAQGRPNDIKFAPYASFDAAYAAGPDRLFVNISQGDLYATVNQFSPAKKIKYLTSNNSTLRFLGSLYPFVYGGTFSNTSFVCAKQNTTTGLYDNVTITPANENSYASTGIYLTSGDTSNSSGCTQFVNVNFNATVWLNNSAVTLRDSQIAIVRGTGVVYLYGNSSAHVYSSAAQYGENVTIVDRRNAGGVAMPLYSGTGINTDGPMHQKATTDALFALAGSGLTRTSVGALNVLSDYPVYVMGGDIDNGLPLPASGYTSLEDSFLNFNSGSYDDLNGERTTYLNAHYLDVKKSFRGSGYLKGDNTALILEPGVVMGMGMNGTPTTLEGIYFSNSLRTYVGGTLSITGTTNNGVETRGTAILRNCLVYTNTRLSGQLILEDSYLSNIAGTGTVYLYGLSDCDNVAKTIKVVDRRPKSATSVKAFPSTGYTAQNTLSTAPTFYYQDGNLAQYVGPVDSNNPMNFDYSNSQYWTLVAGGFLGKERANLKALLSPVTLRQDNPLAIDGSQGPVYVGLPNLYEVFSGTTGIAQLNCNQDNGVITSYKTARISALEGNNYLQTFVKGQGQTLGFGMSISNIKIGTYPVSSYSFSGIMNTTTLGDAAFLVIASGATYTDPQTCTSFFNATLQTPLQLSPNSGVVLRDSTVNYIALGAGATPANTAVYLYGNSYFAGLQAGTPNTVAVYDYRPYKDIPLANGSTLGFTANSFYRLTTSSGATLNLSTDGLVVGKQIRLTITAGAQSFAIPTSGGITPKQAGSFIVGVENVAYITAISPTAISISFTQPVSGRGATDNGTGGTGGGSVTAPTTPTTPAMPLYSGTGQNIDGPMTQQATTNMAGLWQPFTGSTTTPQPVNVGQIYFSGVTAYQYQGSGATATALGPVGSDWAGVSQNPNSVLYHHPTNKVNKLYPTLDAAFTENLGGVLELSPKRTVMLSASTISSSLSIIGKMGDLALFGNLTLQGSLFLKDCNVVFNNGTGLYTGGRSPSGYWQNVVVTGYMNTTGAKSFNLVLDNTQLSLDAPASGTYGWDGVGTVTLLNGAVIYGTLDPRIVVIDYASPDQYVGDYDPIADTPFLQNPEKRGHYYRITQDGLSFSATTQPMLRSYFTVAGAVNGTGNIYVNNVYKGYVSFATVTGANTILTLGSGAYSQITLPTGSNVELRGTPINVPRVINSATLDTQSQSLVDQNFRVGQYVVAADSTAAGYVIPNGTRIVSISGTVLTFNNAITVPFSGGLLPFYSLTTLPNYDTTVTVGSATGMVAGLTMVGVGVNANTVISSINGNVLTLNQPAAVADNSPVTFLTSRFGLSGFVKGSELYSDGKNWSLRALPPGKVFGTVSAVAFMGDGSQLTGIPFTPMQHRGLSVVRFDKDAEYDEITSGSFTVDTTTPVVGVKAVIYLAPTASAPDLSAPIFQRIGTGVYQASRHLMYTLKAGANGKVQYWVDDLGA
jgi:hypothetical protein